MGNWGSRDDEVENPPIVTTTAPPPVDKYNCTYKEVETDIYEGTIRNLSNFTEIICQSILNITDVTNESPHESDWTRLCNHLGNIVCTNCTNDIFYTDRVEDIEFSCSIEETTTQLATTLAITQEETTHVMTNDQNTTGYPDVGGLKTTDIIIIAVAAALSLLVVVMAIVIYQRKRRRGKSDASSQDDVFRVEAEATGELYTIVNKGLTKTQGADNAVSNSNREAEEEEVGPVYTAVDKTRKTDTDVYNVLYGKNGPHDSVEIYSVANPSR